MHVLCGMVKNFYPFISFNSMKITSFLRNNSILFFFLSSVIISGCKKTSPSGTVATIPNVSTVAAILNLTTTTAQSGGVVTFNGDATITQNGLLQLDGSNADNL